MRGLSMGRRKVKHVIFLGTGTQAAAQWAFGSLFLGAVLYEAFGRALFDGVNQFVILEKVRAGDGLPGERIGRSTCRSLRAHYSKSYSHFNATTDRPMLMPQALYSEAQT